MAKRKKRVKKRRAPRPAKRNLCREIVPLDQRPLRKKALQDCRRLMRQVETKRRAWRVFEDEDVPAFQSWLARTFGALQSRMRDTVEKLREKEIWVREIEYEMALSGCRPHTAYRRVKERFESDFDADEWDGADGADAGNPFGDSESSDGDPGEDRAQFEEAILSEEAFEAFLAGVLGMDAREIPPFLYDSLFASYKEDMRKTMGRAGVEDGPPPRAGQPRSRREEEPKRKRGLLRRAKDLYRTLVRRLHPDTRADANANVGALWHEVQEAYAARDAERLQTLLAMTDILEGDRMKDTSLWDLRRVAGELRATSKAIQSSIRKARKDIAWGFAGRADRENLAAAIRTGLEADLAAAEEDLAYFQGLLDKWSRPPRRRKRKRMGGSPVQPGRFVQDELPF